MSQLFEDLKEAAEEMVAIEKGLVKPDPSRVHKTFIPETKSIRKKTGLSQSRLGQIQ